MIQVKLDAEIRSRLNGFHESVDLIDDAGNVVEHVLRLGSAHNCRPWEPPLSEHENSGNRLRNYSSEESL